MFISSRISISTGNINFGGNWTNNGSQFEPGNGTVNLNGSGTAQTLGGSSRFFNLTKIIGPGESGGTLTVNTVGNYVCSAMH